ncbi:Protein CBR-PQN-83 [Aphelenchoides fujianensis]|nr:Protein CBR-PQN-83 [Aphelenchoides fujianensis]
MSDEDRWLSQLQFANGSRPSEVVWKCADDEVCCGTECCQLPVSWPEKAAVVLTVVLIILFCQLLIYARLEEGVCFNRSSFRESFDGSTVAAESFKADFVTATAGEDGVNGGFVEPRIPYGYNDRLHLILARPETPFVYQELRFANDSPPTELRWKCPEGRECCGVKCCEPEKPPGVDDLIGRIILMWSLFWTTVFCVCYCVAKATCMRDGASEGVDAHGRVDALLDTRRRPRRMVLQPFSAFSFGMIPSWVEEELPVDGR